MGRVLLLTRGDAQWGLGHLHRVSWLVDVLAAQRPPLHPAVCCLDSAEARRFWAGRAAHVDFTAPDTDSSELGAALALELTDRDAVVVDWLDSAPGLVCALRGSGARVVLLDDYGAARQHASLVVNALLAPLQMDDKQVGRARLVGGARYVQLPPIIIRLRGTVVATARALETELTRPLEPGIEVHSVLVSFGGSPRAPLIELALSALAEAGYGGRVIVMPAPEGRPPDGGLDVEWVPAGEQFHSLLAAADLAICGGGLTLYEAAFLGVPVVAIAQPSPVPGHEDHQLGTINKLAGAGCCLALGMAGDVSRQQLSGALGELLADPKRRGRMSAAGLSLLDGRGLMRTVEEILPLVRP